MRIVSPSVWSADIFPCRPTAGAMGHVAVDERKDHHVSDAMCEASDAMCTKRAELALH
jgi:hypothetical protein